MRGGTGRRLILRVQSDDPPSMRVSASRADSNQSCAGSPPHSLTPWLLSSSAPTLLSPALLFSALMNGRQISTLSARAGLGDGGQAGVWVPRQGARDVDRHRSGAPFDIQAPALPRQRTVPSHTHARFVNSHPQSRHAVGHTPRATTRVVPVPSGPRTSPQIQRQRRELLQRGGGSASAQTLPVVLGPHERQADLCSQHPRGAGGGGAGGCVGATAGGAGRGPTSVGVPFNI